MKNKRVISVACAVLLGSLASSVQSSNVFSYDACMDQAAGVTVDMSNCIEQHFQVLDQELNQKYKQLLRTASNRPTLIDAQRKWLKNRNKQCDKATTDGTLGDLEVRECYRRTTEERVKTFNHMLK